MIKHLATVSPMDHRPAALPKELQSPPEEKFKPQENKLHSEHEMSDDVHSTHETHADNDEKVDPEYFMSGAKLHILICGLGLAVFIMALDMSILTTAIPKITEKFRSTEDIGWYVSAYLLTL